MPRIYLDNNATTPLAPEVRAAMLPYLTDKFGNPSSAHHYGEESQEGINLARQQVADLINGDPSGIVFTSGGTEANNTAIWSAISSFDERKHIITSNVEHPSVLEPLRFLEKYFGYEIELLPVDTNGRLHLDKLEAAIRPETVLVSLMGANNETGVLWPVREIGELCRSRSVLFHCDAVQLIGKEPMDINQLPIDYLTIAAHKLHGPKGIGAIHIQRRAPFRPQVMGAGQENGRRAGTENVAGIVGFGQACKLAAQSLADFSRKMAELRNHLEKTTLAAIPDILINGGEAPRLGNTSNISFRDCAANGIIQELDQRGIAVSAHSACHSDELSPSHVLTAMHVPETHIHGTLRISLSRYTTSTEIETFLDILPDLISKSRQTAV
jgi:cysteine desulfurase